MNFKEIFIDALPIIKKFAPTVASAIGGPVGLAAGYVVPLLSQVFESHPSDISGLAQKIVADPLAADKLAQFESGHSDFISGLLDNINDLSSAEITIKLNWEPNK